MYTVVAPNSHEDALRRKFASEKQQLLNIPLSDANEAIQVEIGLVLKRIIKVVPSCFITLPAPVYSAGKSTAVAIYRP